DRAVMLGTSLGGIVIMLLAAAAPERIAAAVINDIGPEVEPAGLARIREYVGQGRSFPTWMHAASGLRHQAGIAYPGVAISDWLRLAKRQMAAAAGGRTTSDYDMQLAEPIHPPQGIAPVDMWLSFLAPAERPVLALRGDLSGLLSVATLARMAREVPGLEAVTVPRVGHAPTLEEPVAQQAISALLARVA